MADADVIVTFGADVSELQAALNAMQAALAQSAAEAPVATGGSVEAEALKQQGKAAQDAGQQVRQMGQDGQDALDKIEAGGKKAKGGLTQVDREIKDVIKYSKQLNNAVGDSMFNLAHGAVQGGAAFKTAQKQMWKDIHSAALSTMKHIVRDFVSNHLSMVELTKLFGFQSTEAEKMVFGRKAALNAQSTANVVASQQAQTAAVAAGNSERAATEATAAATQTATQSESVLKHAGSAAAAVYDDVAQIPLVGWLLAPAAAGAAFAAVSAFSAAGGWERVPYDGALTELHKDEMVLPAAVANTVRAASAAVGGFTLPQQAKDWSNPAMPAVASTAAGSGGGQAVTINYTPSVSAIDTRGARAFLDQHGRYIVDVLSRQQRNFAQVKK